MPGWLGYGLYFLIIFVALAPSRVLGPVFGAIARVAGPAVVGLLSLGAAVYVLRDDPSDRQRLIGYGELALAAVCAAWWVYRRFVPVYRDQAPESAPMPDDR